MAIPKSIRTQRFRYIFRNRLNENTLPWLIFLNILIPKQRFTPKIQLFKRSLFIVIDKNDKFWMSYYFPIFLCVYT